VKGDAVRLLTKGLGFALVALTGMSRVSAAQVTEVDIGGLLGVSLPTQEGADLYVPGWVAGGNIRVVPAAWPVGLQVDITSSSYNRDVANIADRGLNILTGSLSVVYQVELTASPIEPYGLVGVAVNRMSVNNPRTIDNYGTNTAFGLVLGGGVAFKKDHSRIAPLIDFRLLGIFGSDPRETAYINFSIGLQILLKGRHAAP
jgi:hypothetical protein